MAVTVGPWVDDDAADEEGVAPSVAVGLLLPSPPPPSTGGTTPGGVMPGGGTPPPKIPKTLVNA